MKEEKNEVTLWRPEKERTKNLEANKIHNCLNPWQMDNKKVVCCCTAGLLRSPTTALVLSMSPYNYNTRAVGLEESFALIDFTKVLAIWADEIVVMTKQHAAIARMMLEEWGVEKPIVTLHIPDNFQYRNKDLVELIKERYNQYLESKKG